HPDLGGSLQVEVTETFGRHQAAICDAAGKARVLRTEQRVAHGRMDAVGPDEHVGRYRSAVLELRFDPIVAVDQMLETTAEVYAVGGESAHKRAMELGAMKCVMRRAEFIFDQRPERRAQEEAAVVPAPLVEAVRLHAARAKPLGQAEAMQKARGVRPDVDA